MSEKNYLVILNALAETIEDLKLQIYLKDIKINELEKKIGEKNHD